MADVKPRKVKHAGDVPVFPVLPRSRGPRPKSTRSYGWVPDLPDARDHQYAAPMFATLPTKFSLRNEFPVPYQQGQLKSCVAQAIAAAVQFDRAKQRLPFHELTPSRLFIDYNGRALEGRVDFDAPCHVRTVIKGLAAYGACFEGPAADQWPYVVARFKDKPPAACFKSALKDRPISYSRLTQEIHQLKACLASGYPFVFGFTAYDSIETKAVAKTGDIPLPKPHERTLGGHVVLAIGYDDAKQQLLIRNSWGREWGNGGYGTLPYGYVTSHRLASDFWTIRVMSPTAIR